jgi:hypothetical protein
VDALAADRPQPCYLPERLRAPNSTQRQVTKER